MFPSGGAEPAHVALDPVRGLLYVTNYTGGSLSVYHLDGQSGSILGEKGPIFQEKLGNGSGVVADRQEAAHAHGTFLYKEFAYVVDLGGDKIYHYKASRYNISAACSVSNFSCFCRRARAATGLPRCAKPIPPSLRWTPAVDPVTSPLMRRTTGPILSTNSR